MQGDDDPTDNADAKGALAQLQESLGEIAAMRQAARELGLQIPEDIRQHVLKMRRLLREAGLPQETIDATPGLEPPNDLGPVFAL